MKITLIGMPYLREHLATQKKCVELAPTWSKAKLRLIYCYISLDDVEEACGHISPLLLNKKMLAKMGSLILLITLP